MHGPVLKTRVYVLNCFVFLIIPSGILTILDHRDTGDLDLYKISWEGQMQENNPHLNGENVINISTKNKERYLCVVPDDDDHLNFDNSAENSTSKNEKDKSPVQVLEPLLKSNYCSYKFELFWVYELCHGKFLRQYHEENAKYNAKITQEYFLGKMEFDQIELHEEEYQKQEFVINGQSPPTILVNGQYKPYVMFNMTGGTTCDLTKSSRVSKIIYVCNDESKHELYSIKEISTCEYEAIVLSPLLCQLKGFRVDTNKHDIKCYSVGDSPRKPIKSIETDEEEESRDAKRRLGGVAYFQGRTLIIDADLLLS